VAQEHGFDEGADDGFFVGVEVLDGFEVEAKIVGGAAFVGVEDELIGADGERDCESADDVEGGLGAAGFIAAELADVDAGAFGESGLGEAAVFAEGGESVGEVHGEGSDERCGHVLLHGLASLADHL